MIRAFLFEYGLMQSYAEGLGLMQAKQEFNLDLKHIAEIRRYRLEHAVKSGEWG